MKKHHNISLLILFVCVSFYTSWAQNVSHEKLTLSVKRNVENKAQELHFKPNKKLKVLTKTGEVLVSNDYSFLNDAIVLNGKEIKVVEKNERHPKFKETAISDTISLSDIDWIKGRVLEDGERKALGGLVLLVGTGSLFIPVASVIVAGAAGALLAIPLVPIIIIGYKMMIGTRKFKTSKGWQLRIE